MNLSNIPQELKVNALWCLWRLEDGKGKVPYNALTKKMARSNDKSTFHNFQTVIANLHEYFKFDENGKVTGGIGLGIFNGYSAIDIDNCIDSETGKQSKLAKEIIDFCGSYTEISPSGKGLRIIFKTDSKIDKSKYYINNSKLGLEIYISENTNKYVTITGNVLYQNDIKKINIQHLLDKFMLKKKPTQTIISRRNGNLDSRLRVALQKDTKLAKLWNSVAPGSGSNESEMDLALCNKIAFYVDGNPDMINSSFIESPYFQSKDSLHKKKWIERDDYREMTISKSLESIREIEASITNTEDFNDTGNAIKLIERFGRNLKFNVDNEKWMIYNGKYWQTDIYNSVKQFAEIIAEDLKQQMLLNGFNSDLKSYQRNINRILSSSGKSAMIKEAQHIHGVPVVNDDFDKEDYILNCESGILDLRNGTIIPHNKNKMLSKFTPFEIVDKKPERWLKFLDEIFEGNKEIIDYVHKVAGYSLTGSTKEQAMFILFGDGANGKSLFLEILNTICGSYGSTSNVEILLEKKYQSANLGDVARLNRIRNVITDETKLGDKLNESAIKTMTSGIGKIVARFLYGNEFEFTPIFKIFMATNYKPVIRGTDFGIWRRLKIIPFNKVFTKQEQDKELIYKLKEEINEIFSWVVQGAKKWYKEGLEEPEILTHSLEEYKTEMDVIQQWILESCDVGNFKELSADLFNNYIGYAAANKEYEMSQTLFGRNMSKKFKKKRMGGKTYYEGIRLKKDKLYYLKPEEINEI